MKTMICTPIERRNARAVPDEIEKKQSENGVVHNEHKIKREKATRLFSTEFGRKGKEMYTVEGEFCRVVTMSYKKRKTKIRERELKRS